MRVQWFPQIMMHECPEEIEVIELSKIIRRIGTSGDRLIGKSHRGGAEEKPLKHGGKKEAEEFARRLRRIPPFATNRERGT